MTKKVDVVPTPEVPVTVIAPVPPSEFNHSLLYLIYILYKVNILARNNVKQIMHFIKTDKTPEDILEYLTQEAKK